VAPVGELAVSMEPAQHRDGLLSPTNPTDRPG